MAGAIITKACWVPGINNMVLSFHKYWNQNDQQSIQHIADFRNQYNMPVWIGETGENSNTWFTEAIQLFEKNNIGWCWWPLKKLGNNNPLQIKSNPAYDSLVNYWNGKSSLPPAHVYDALMELAEQTKCENNIVHRDVIDAMIRQPFSRDAIPFKANKISDGTVIYAVDYDLGVNGVAYYDMDTANYRISTGKESMGNRGRTYRNDGVDIYEDSIQKGNFYVGHTEDGEWLQYTIDVLEAGSYNLKIAVSAGHGAGALSVSAGSGEEQQTIIVPSKVGDENWETVIAKNYSVEKRNQSFADPD